MELISWIYVSGSRVLSGYGNDDYRSRSSFAGSYKDRTVSEAIDDSPGLSRQGVQRARVFRPLKLKLQRTITYAFKWKRLEDKNLWERNWVSQFNHTNFGPLNFFRLFYPDNASEMIVVQTNWRMPCKISIIQIKLRRRGAKTRELQINRASDYNGITYKSCRSRLLGCIFQVF